VATTSYEEISESVLDGVQESVICPSPGVTEKPVGASEGVIGAVALLSAPDPFAFNAWTVKV
jgi:hypothetical protein